MNTSSMMNKIVFDKRAVISCSGGMDSTSLLVKLVHDGYKVDILNFNYGSKQNTIERSRLQANIDFINSQVESPVINYKLIDLSEVMGSFYSSLTDANLETPEGNYADENMKITVVPNRNAIFASIIYGYALSIAKRENCTVKIAMGVHSGDHTIYPDCRPEFVETIYKAFAIGNWDSDKVDLFFPYINIDKGDVLQDCYDNCESIGLDFTTIMKNTLTCYKPTADGKSCGKCGSCTERLEAFANHRLEDPLDYVKE